MNGPAEIRTPDLHIISVALYQTKPRVLWCYSNKPVFIKYLRLSLLINIFKHALALLDRMGGLAKAITSFSAMVLLGLALWIGTDPLYSVNLLVIALTGGVLSYLLSAAICYEYFETDPKTFEKVGLYHGAYTLLATYIFVAITTVSHLGLATVFAAPFAYFFPAAHTKCELHPDNDEEHIVTAKTMLLTVLFAVVAASIVYL